MEKINEVIEYFDFEKVHKVMEYSNWTWFDNGGKVPSVEELKKEAYRLLFDAVCSDSEISCGGLKATVNSKDDYYRREFVLADSFYM